MRIAALTMLTTALAPSSAAWAQPSTGAGPIPDTNYASTADEDLPVMSRPRPEYDAKGIPVGGFRVFPDLKLRGSYDTNIYRTQTARVDDFVGTVSPTLRVQSQWGRHMLEVYGGISSQNYVRNGSENTTDWNAGADGRYDIESGSSVFAAGSAGLLHEARSSPNTVGFQGAPNRYFAYHAETSATFQPNRLGITAGGIYDGYAYLNTPLVGGGTLNNKDRNYQEYQGLAKVSYDFSPGYSGFIRGVYDNRQFTQTIDRSGVARNSNGYRVDAGLDLQISHLVSGEFYVGYLDQKFKAPLQNVTGVDYAGRLNWLASPELTIHLEGAHNLSQVILAGASVSDDKSVTLGADYELERDLLVQVYGGYTDSTFPGITRHDQAPQGGAGLKWLMDSNLSLNLNYDYSERATNIAGFNYNDHMVTLGLNLHD